MGIETAAHNNSSVHQHHKKSMSEVFYDNWRRTIILFTLNIIFHEILYFLSSDSVTLTYMVQVKDHAYLLNWLQWKHCKYWKIQSARSLSECKPIVIFFFFKSNTQATNFVVTSQIPWPEVLATKRTTIDLSNWNILFLIQKHNGQFKPSACASWFQHM